MPISETGGETFTKFSGIFVVIPRCWHWATSAGEHLP